MNTYLVNRYCIPLDLDPNVTNPGIAEIPYENVNRYLTSPSLPLRPAGSRAGSEGLSA